MKQSKTPLYKKSCLAYSLSYDNMTEWLEEVGENGDMYGYEDSSIEGYYNEYKEQFDELSGGAWSLYEQLTDGEIIYGKYDDFRDKISSFEEELAIQECKKRLMRLTKEELIDNFRKVLMVLVMF